MNTYLYKLNEPSGQFAHVHPFYIGVEYKNDWISITNGALSVLNDYAWDGCTPKWQPLGLITVGTPDGASRYGKPWLYYVSLIHDVLCQFRAVLPFTQKQVTQIFKEDMQRAKWPLWRLYTAGVDCFGPQDFAS